MIAVVPLHDQGLAVFLGEQSIAVPVIPAVGREAQIAAQPSGAVASGGWTWASLFWFAATFAVFGAYYGIVRASEVRTRRLTFTRRRDLRPAVAWTCIVVVAALILIRLTVARGVFSEGDAQLWTPWQKAPMSWALALLVASLIAVAAVRSSRRRR